MLQGKAEAEGDLPTIVRYTKASQEMTECTTRVPVEMARRKLTAEKDRSLVDYADKEPTAFASMLGGLIEANVRSRSEKQKDFDPLVARVGIWVTDIDEA